MARGNQKPLFGPADIPGLLGEGQEKMRSLREGALGFQLDLARTLGQIGPEAALGSLPGSGHAWAQGKLPMMEGWDQTGTHPGASENLAEGNYGQWAMQRGAQMADGATLAAPVLGPVAGAGVVVGSQGLKNILFRIAQLNKRNAWPTFTQRPLPKEFENFGPETLQKARAMKKEGRGPERIREETNIGEVPWEPGKPRFEISDAKAHFESDWVIQNSTFVDTAGRQRYSEWDLKDVLDHPALYEAYPNLRYVRFRMEPDPTDILKGTENMQGWFSPNQNVINVTPYANNPKSTLLHEIQHWIQETEGFGGGSNTPDAIKAFVNSSRPEKAKVFQQAQVEVTDLMEEQDWLLRGWERAFTKPKVQEFTEEYAHGIKKYDAAKQMRRSAAAEQSALDPSDPKFPVLEKRVQDLDILLANLDRNLAGWQQGAAKELFPQYKTWREFIDNADHKEIRLLEELLEDFSMQKYLEKKSRFSDYTYWLNNIKQRDPQALIDFLERHHTGYNYYFRKDGEVEARMVQGRMHLRQEDLDAFPWKMPPKASTGFDPDSVDIAGYGRGNYYSRSVPDDEILSIDPKTGAFK